MNIRLAPHLTFWLTIAVLILAVLIIFSDILMPFALGLVLAYLFDPLADRGERLGVPRVVSAFLIVLTISVAILTALALILPAVLEQLAQLAQAMPTYIERLRDYLADRWETWLKPLEEQLIPPEGATAEEKKDALTPARIAENVVPWLVGQLQGLLQSGLALVNSLALLFVTPVIAFFLIKDWDVMIRNIDRALPRDDAPTIRQLADEIDWTISNYLRGQLTVLLILSAFYMFALQMAGLNYGLLIGLVAGMISFIPYLGSFTGFVLAGSVAVVQFWPDWFPIATVLAIFLVGQAIEGNVLTPKIVGDKVRLHPVWLIFALFAFGYLFGFTGLILAVPLAAIIGVLVRHVLRRYYLSPAYLPEEEILQQEEAPKIIKPTGINNE